MLLHPLHKNHLSNPMITHEKASILDSDRHHIISIVSIIYMLWLWISTIAISLRLRPRSLHVYLGRWVSMSLLVYSGQLVMVTSPVEASSLLALSTGHRSAPGFITDIQPPQGQAKVGWGSDEGHGTHAPRRGRGIQWNVMHYTDQGGSTLDHGVGEGVQKGMGRGAGRVSVDEKRRMSLDPQFRHGDIGFHKIDIGYIRLSDVQ